MGTKYYKHAPFYTQPAVKDSFVFDPYRKTYLPRRTLYAQEFNRDATRRAEPRIAQCVAKFLQKLDRYSQSGRPANLTNGFLCLMVDGVTQYIYQEPYGSLDADDFNSDILVLAHDFTEMMQWPLYLPRLCAFLFTSVEKLPLWVQDRWLNGMAAQKRLSNVSERNN
ncbi:MAG: hypothetical protein Q9202_005041 [Teloschistes flavicans]